MIENQQSATDTRRGPCLSVDSKTDGALIKVTGCNETNERQNWAYTLKGQVMVSFECLQDKKKGLGENFFFEVEVGLRALLESTIFLTRFF